MAALRERLLCQVVPPPPPNVDFGKLNNPDAHYKTQRERVAVHLEDPACAGCHKITDPMGLALEASMARAASVRKRTARSSTPTASSTACTSPMWWAWARRCMTTRRCRAAWSTVCTATARGGAAKPTDRPLLKYYTAEFQKAGYKLPDVLRTITTSDAFKHVTDAKKVNSSGAREPTEEIQIEEQMLPPTTTVDSLAACGSHTNDRGLDRPR